MVFLQRPGVVVVILVGADPDQAASDVADVGGPGRPEPSRSDHVRGVDRRAPPDVRRPGLSAGEDLQACRQGRRGRRGTGRRVERGVRRPRRQAAALEDAAALTLGRAAPHTVIDAVGEGVLQAHARSCGQVLQIRRARSTPTPSLGKKIAGGWFRQVPSAIHAVSVSSYIVSPRLSALDEALNRPLRFPTEKFRRSRELDAPPVRSVPGKPRHRTPGAH